MIQRVCKVLSYAVGYFRLPGTKHASGTTVPTDGTAGYTKGCPFIKTDGGAGTTLYINEGSYTSCDFNAK